MWGEPALHRILVSEDFLDRVRRVVDMKLVENEERWLKSAGLSRGYFSSRRSELAKGKAPNPGTKALEALCQALAPRKLRSEWLLHGTGAMFVEDPDKPYSVEDAARIAVVADAATKGPKHLAQVQEYMRERGVHLRAKGLTTVADYVEAHEQAIATWKAAQGKAGLTRGQQAFGEAAEPFPDDD